MVQLPPDVPGWCDFHVLSCQRPTIMDSQGRGLPRYVFQAVSSPDECLICSNVNTALWLSTSIITLTNVTYLVRTGAQIKRGPR